VINVPQETIRPVSDLSGRLDIGLSYCRKPAQQQTMATSASVDNQMIELTYQLYIQLKNCDVVLHSVRIVNNGVKVVANLIS